MARPDHRDLEALGTAQGSPRRPGLTAQREALAGLGVNADRVYVAIAGELTARGVKLSLGGSVHDPTDPVGRLLFNVLTMVAKFEADLARARTREGWRWRGEGPAAR